MTFKNEKTTPQKKLDDIRMQSLQHSKLVALSEMAGGIAHEINNPLAIISGQAGIIKKLNNAIDAVNQIDEPYRWVELSVDTSPSWTIISVTNSGPKIDEALHNKIFNPFFSTKEFGEGTGIGLSISRKIMESHNGLLTLDRAGYYTSFLIKLPFALKPQT